MLYECGGDSSLGIYHSEENAGKSTHTQAGWEVDDIAATSAGVKSRERSPASPARLEIC